MAAPAHSDLAGKWYRLECPSGLAGDMFLGACLDLGMPIAVLEEVVAALGLSRVGVEGRRARRGGVAGIRFRVLRDGRPIEGPDPEEEPPQESPAAPVGAHRSFTDIRATIERSALPRSVVERSVELFARLAEVEAAIHGIAVDRVHFHELGALDSLVDVVGACAALEHLRPARLTCGTVVVGSGRARTAHGVLPVPAPATAALLHGVPTVGEGEGELVTPTGALLLGAFVDHFGAAPPMRASGEGYGLGRRQLADRPNAARLTVGEPVVADDAELHEVAVLETQVDDATGETLGFTLERLLESGALDVFSTAVGMKKSRPGVLLTVVCRPQDERRLAALTLSETGSLGCRISRQRRLEAERASGEVATRFGPVAVKWARLDGRVLGATPEYEACRAIARRAGVAWREVHRAALAALDEAPSPWRGDWGG
ncbi:MAG TPA: nickel pincer cofactor biosynthesis protein LarC [Thermoanaerobaculia bacterium]|nr:nickel pincer cofactor biosynthesis protein LarC [Thermoanaerobaculia bacterium]